MNKVVACPTIPEVKVLANVIRPTQSTSSPVTCRGSKLPTWNRAISVAGPAGDACRCASRASSHSRLP
jgi:hypothetical protein